MRTLFPVPVVSSSMGDPQEKTHPSKPKTTRRHFLGCFGFSGTYSSSISQKKLMVQQQEAADHRSKEDKSTWFSRSTTRFSRNYKHGIKTFPVDASLIPEKKKNNKNKTTTTNDNIEDKRIALKKKSKLEGKSAKVSSDGQYIRAASSSSGRNPPADTAKVVTSRQSSEENPREEEIIRESEKHLDHKDAPKDGLCQLKRLSFRSKLDAGQSGSPEDNPNSSRTTTTAPTHQQPAGNPAVQRRVMVRKKSSQANDAMVKVKPNCLGPEIGMSIIMVALMVLFLCGRFCAVLCTCAFFYFVPRLRATVYHLDDAAAAGPGKDNLVSNDQLDFNSEEHKRRVILEGLLERRNHQSP